MFFIPRRIAFLLIPALLAAQSAKNNSAHVQGVRFWSFGDVTRVAVETEGDYKLYSEQIEKPNRVFFDLTSVHTPVNARQNMQVKVIPVGDHRIRQIRVARLTSSKMRIVIDLDSPVEVSSSQLVNPDRLMIEIRPKGTALQALAATRTPAVHAQTGNRETSEAVKIAAKTVAKSTRPALTEDDPDDAYHPPPRGGTTNPVAVPAAASPVATSQPAPLISSPAPAVAASASAPNVADRSLVRVFGLKLGRVVIDAGHGGHDSGTIGPNGLMEKDLVLDVALRLGALITKQMGAEVIYTRSTDVFIPLEERTKIANEQKADLFISVHANSSPEPEATGVETYYFNLTADKSGLDLATRENATADSSISDLNDLLHRAVLLTKREESREFAQKVQASLIASSSKAANHMRDRGVKQAPFVVLIGATMPSILAEIGFVSNPRDEKMMRRSDQKQKIAEALFKGVEQYASSLGHVQMARAGE